jgi:hypothetical protein
MTLEDSVQALRLRVMRRAEELGNVSAACREQGISRSLFYRWRQRVERSGVDVCIAGAGLDYLAQQGFEGARRVGRGCGPVGRLLLRGRLRCLGCGLRDARAGRTPARASPRRAGPS